MDRFPKESAESISTPTLEPTNRDAHLLVAETAWVPLVRSNQDNLLLPAYGLEINPFLLRDLQYKYPGDWFEIAINRERRWRVELNAIFPGPRWRTAAAGMPLRDGRRVVKPRVGSRCSRRAQMALYKRGASMRFSQNSAPRSLLRLGLPSKIDRSGNSLDCGIRLPPST
jgi:hypothetical protein